MGWTIATYIGRAVLIVLLPTMLVVVYHLIKQQLEINQDIKTLNDRKCIFCERVSIEVWACHNDKGVCINCCYCPDHQDTIHENKTCKTAAPNTWCGSCAEIN